MNLAISTKQTAKIISEVLPYIKKFKGQTLVIKFGGHAMIDESLKEDFAKDIALLHLVGFKLVIIHGGGAQIGKKLNQSGIKAEFNNGLRKTSLEVMQIVKEVLLAINTEITTKINQHCEQNIAKSITPNDGLLLAQKINEDLGYVGEITKVMQEQILAIIANRQIPVIVPVATDINNNFYNINADTAASKIAQSLKAEKILLLTDIQGVLDHKQNLITELNNKKIKALIKEGLISGGMIPKVVCSLEALNNGVRNAHIIDGRVSHALLIELLTNQGIGTLIR